MFKAIRGNLRRGYRFVLRPLIVPPGLGKSLVSYEDLIRWHGDKLELPHKILIGAHHKAGTAWMESIFRKVSQTIGLNFQTIDKMQQIGEGNDILFHTNSKFPWDDISGPYRGLHIIRDPRDMVVSACFYHQKAGETWLHKPLEIFDGLTFQQKINSFPSFSEKMAFQMQYMDTPQKMAEWDYSNNNFIEVKYEDLIADDQLYLFHKVFDFLGFPGRYIPVLLKIAYQNSLFSGNLKKGVHHRSGKTQQWRQHFSPENKELFIERFGDVLIKLGYETDHQWVISNTHKQ
jgi:hypothetical protein